MLGLLSHPFLKPGERGREGDLTVLFAFIYGKRHVDEGWLGKARLLLTDSEGNTCERREHIVSIQSPGGTRHSLAGRLEFCPDTVALVKWVTLHTDPQL